MLTKLRIRGFKNLLDAEIRLGPFTCIAGANGVGKSNVFDAIHFLNLLTSKELIEAAQSIRDVSGRSGSIEGLFFRSGNHPVDSMRFEAEMITPLTATDHLRQDAEATSTFLRYTLELRYRGEESGFGPLEIVEEDLSYIGKNDAHNQLLFPHSVRNWRDRILVQNRKTGKPYLRTEDDGTRRVIRIQQDGTGGRPQNRLAEPLPRTVLSSLSAAESPTAVVARAEMASWRLLQLEPSALRKSDEFRDPAEVAADGAHMPATLYRLVGNGKDASPDRGEAVRQQIANRLAELIHDVRSVRIERDEKRQLLTLLAQLSDRTEHPARSLSDGTLRFLALAIIEQSRQSGGLYCLEEPENGIHPQRVPSMLQLLQDIAVDPDEPDGPDNPLRQVIINTHSPLVVADVPDDCLVVAEPVDVDGSGFGFPARVASVRFAALADTWRTEKGGSATCSKGALMKHLGTPPFSNRDEDWPKRRRLVKDRLAELTPMFPFAERSVDEG